MVAFAAAVPLRAIDADRDFSGRWFLDPQGSNIQALPALPDRLLGVVQRETAFRCTATAEDGTTAVWSFSTDGQESKYTLGPEHRKVFAKWEGAALLVTTVVSGPPDYSIFDRWTLSKDRSNLTIERQFVRATGQVEGTALYRREGQTQLTVRLPSPAPSPPQGPQEKPQPAAPQPAAPQIVVRAGTHVPLTLVNALNTKQSHEGDGVYLETAFPIFVDGRLVIPRNSYVQGTVTKATPAGHVKGKSELYIRFDSLTLPNGVARDFRSRLDSADADAQGNVDRSEGTITGENRTGSNVGTVARGAGMGASVGSIAGAASGHFGMGVGLGGAAGGLAGLASAMGHGGNGVVLPRGTTMEMVLDRDLLYTPDELRF
jgi:type IV secretion system protein VirB10